MKDYSKIVSQSELEVTKNALESKGFTVKVAKNKQQAKEIVLGLVKKGSQVFTATSVTLDQLGLTKELNGEKYISTRSKFMPLYGQEDKKHEMKSIGSVSEYAVGSVNAVTQEGELLMASATGSQIPNYAYGASNVIWVVSTSKIVKDMNEAMHRLENHTFPLEDVRAQKAYGTSSSINFLLVYRKDPTNRATIVFVEEPLGF